MASNLAGTINATTPLWTALIAYAVSADRGFNVPHVVGLVLGFTGAVVLASLWNPGSVAKPAGLNLLDGAALILLGVALIQRRPAGASA